MPIRMRQGQQQAHALRRDRSFAQALDLPLQALQLFLERLDQLVAHPHGLDQLAQLLLAREEACAVILPVARPVSGQRIGAG